MAGVHIAPALNDENSSNSMMGSTTALKAPTAAAPLPVAASKQACSSVLKSARKAFGNITNSQQQPSAAKPSASKQQPLQQRRALGDITNSAAKPHHQQHGGGAVKQQQQGASSSSSAPQQAAPGGGSAVAAAAAASAKWAADVEPERPAGKTWEQLEAERWAAMDAEADASASRILAGMLRLAPPVTGMLAALHTGDDDDDLRALAQPPLRRLQPAWGNGQPAAAQQPVGQDDDVSLDDLLLLPSSASDLASLLPDIWMPAAAEVDEQAAIIDEAGNPTQIDACRQDVVHGGSSCRPAAHAGVDGGPSAPAGVEQQLLRSPDPTPW